jgi:uncharacterized damage-inducible protein DinB
MDSRRKNIVDAHSSREPEIGRWLWALQDCRKRTLEELADISPAMVDWRPPDGESGIGAILYHIADIEADWLYVEVLERPFPPQVIALLTHETRDAQGRLTQVRGFSLEQHRQRLAIIRDLLLDVYQQMDLADFRRPRALPHYDVTPEWVLHHLMQHEAEHRSQIGSLRDRAKRALAEA